MDTFQQKTTYPNGLTASEGGFSVQGDFDGDELGLLLRWPQSCWHGYLLYSYQNGEWRQQTQASVNSCMERDFKNIFDKGETPHEVISLEYGWNDEYTKIIRPRYLINLETGDKHLLDVIDQ